jgi:hypothetical protein
VLIYSCRLSKRSIHLASEPYHRRLEAPFKISSICLLLKDFGRKLKQIFSLKLSLVICSTITEGIILKGFLGFMTKFIEYQFEMTATLVTIIFGAIALISVIGGTLLSAFIINKFKLESKHCALLCSIIFFITSFCFLMFLNYCPEKKFASEQFQNSTNVTCSSACNCENKYNPVCYQNYIFQSPCHIGCTKQVGDNEFANCKCIYLYSQSFSNFSVENATAYANLTLSSNKCDKDIKCTSKLIVNGLAAFIVVFLTAMSIIPHFKAVLGSVEHAYQPFALGIKAAFVGILGNFAGTIIVGRAVDLTCKYWQKNFYNQQVCKIYKNQSLSLSLALIGFICRLLSAIFISLACLLFFRKPKVKDRYSMKVELNDKF